MQFNFVFVYKCAFLSKTHCVLQAVSVIQPRSRNNLGRYEIRKVSFQNSKKNIVSLKVKVKHVKK